MTELNMSSAVAHRAGLSVTDLAEPLAFDFHNLITYHLFRNYCLPLRVTFLKECLRCPRLMKKILLYFAFIVINVIFLMHWNKNVMISSYRL